MESNIFASFAFNAAGQTHPSDDKCIAEDFQGVKNCPERDLEDPKVCLDVEDLRGFGSAPFDWPKVVQAIRSMRASQDAPVDQMGTHKLADRTADEKTQQFQLLVAAVISSQTRDSVTAAAMTRLHGLPGGLTVYSLSNPMLTVTQLAEFLKPVGFYRQKAKHLKAIAETICGPPLNGCIPNTLKELVSITSFFHFFSF
ncbi:hypothetical protein KP509_13G090000 [Ceratopteris richardii]|uniref:HhH-GPD domain-containing protein n=1 Tax=Ceratopteris richardii TaxID=49495 RepID=A0A8T2THW0_CERRI|nr:hypothetical protein KP509_13G090000 [Ceratopteris richardii]